MNEQFDLEDQRRPQRTTSFADGHRVTVVDRVGRALSTRRLRVAIGDVSGKVVADVGCAHDAALARSLFAGAGKVYLFDLSISPAVEDALPQCEPIEGYLPTTLTTVATGSVDVIVSNNVIEHLWEPELTLQEMHRMLRPGGTCVVNVPSWWGKRWLELAAFRLGVAPASEMDDHKIYYDPKDLWPLLVRAGFRPSRISCRRHKFGMNTIAVCTA